jgi:hypothetical protein
LRGFAGDDGLGEQRNERNDNSNEAAFGLRDNVMFPAHAMGDEITEIATDEQNGNCGGDLTRRKTVNGTD